MKIEIHYCIQWNYKPDAASLADELKKSLSVDADLVPGKGGIFDVLVDGDLVYSKAKTGRFPEPGEVTRKIQK